MKVSRLILSGITLITCSVFANEPRVWGVKELDMALASAKESFKEHQGQEAYDAISGFSIDRTSQGDTAKAKINYKVGETAKTASFFCHAHSETEIDCH